MINSSKLFSSTKRSTWTIAFITSLILLSIVIFQTDWKTVVDIWEGITWALVFVALILLLMEGVCTSIRMYLYIPGKTELSSCFRVVAWYVLMLVLLPARLGEVVAVFLLKENLNQKTSPAIMIILVQRLFDILVLSALFVVIYFAYNQLISPEYLFLLALGILLILTTLILKLDVVLGQIAFILHTKRSSRLKSLLHGVLRARTWSKHSLNGLTAIGVLFITIAKWFFNLAGFSILIIAIDNTPGFIDGLIIGIAYNFLAIIPLQTIGGIGIGEIGLTGILLLYGIPVSIAAGVSIFVRLIMILVPFLFWTFVQLLIPGRPKLLEAA